MLSEQRDPAHNVQAIEYIAIEMAGRHGWPATPRFRAMTSQTERVPMARELVDWNDDHL